MAPIYNWTGFYIGGHVGGAFSSDSNFTGLATAITAWPLPRGVQVGADWQFAPNWVLGAQGQYSWVGGHVAPLPRGLPQQQPARARLGHRPLGYTWVRGWSMSKALRLFRQQ